MDLGFAGATVAVTGGTAGMGRAAAACFAADGARVAVLARSQATLTETVAELRALGSPDAIGLATDLSRPDQVTTAFDELAGRWGELNVLVNTVGPGSPILGSFDEIDDKIWKLAFELVTMSAVRTCRAALPMLRAAEWARVVNVSAHSVKRQSSPLIAYTAAKAALTSFSKNLSLTLAPEGILVNTVSPGTFVTAQILDHLAPVAAAQGIDLDDPRAVVEVLQKEFGDAIGHLGRAGLPDEAGVVIAFLASRRNNFMTGADDPAFQVAGVLVHHEEKEGRDAGDLVGIDPMGVPATRDIDALVALRADCMLWHGLTWEPQVVARFLAAGTNVYSGMGGWYLPGEPEHELLAAACEEGGSTFAAGGNIPGLISDVLPLFISGYSGRVRFIRAWQSNYVPHYPSALQLQFGLGIGVEPDLTATEPSEVDKAWLWGIRQSARMVGAGLGVPVTDVRLTNKEYAATPEDMELWPSGLKVARGTPAGVRWTYTAYAGDVPFFELINEQTVRLGLGEGWRASAGEPNWRLEVTGEPNIHAAVSLPDEGEGVAPVSALNAARAVNFVPRLVAARAGCLSVLDVAAPTATTRPFDISQ